MQRLAPRYILFIAALMALLLTVYLKAPEELPQKQQVKAGSQVSDFAPTDDKPSKPSMKWATREPELSADAALPPEFGRPFNPAEWKTAPGLALPGASQASSAFIGAATAAPRQKAASAGRENSIRAEGPGLSALREIEQVSSPQNQNRLGGVVTKSLAAVSPAPASTIAPSPTAPSTGAVRLSGQARGYMMLALMHPAARATVENQLGAMLRAEISQLYLGVLVDGTFTLDFGYLSEVISRLSIDGRSVTLVLYFISGPSMRGYPSLPIDAGFNAISPVRFRSLIEQDAGTREEYQRMLRRAIPVYQLNRRLSPGAINIAIPMLEDNLNDRSYSAIRELTRQTLGDVAETMRNPCPRCVSGNTSTSFGDGIESHTTGQMAQLGPLDGFAMDGSGYRFAEEAEGNQLNLDETRTLLTDSKARGLRFFGIWRAQRQGLYVGPRLHPDERIYEVPSEAQLLVEIDLLRHGL